MSDKDRYLQNLQGEVDSASLYRTLAEVERSPAIAQVYCNMAAVEDVHADYWRGQLAKIGVAPRTLKPGTRSKILGWLARRFGTEFVLPTLQQFERADVVAYGTQQEAMAVNLPAAERSHARLLRAIGTPSGGMAGNALARLEGRHRAVGGNSLRAAVLGANDGLVSNLSLVMGVAGAGMEARSILVTGIAGLLAGACSMAMGEWLSVNSSRELYQHQIAIESEELVGMPAAEEAELALIYQAKGLGKEEATTLASSLMSKKDQALDTLVREELGIDPQQLGGSPTAAAAISFLLFAVGALIPVMSFFWLSGTSAVLVSLGISGVAMFAIGAGITLVTGRNALFSGARQLFIGFAAAAITYGLGRVFGAVLA